MIKIIAIVVLVLVAALLVYTATRPDTFSVERTTRIQAPPEKIFPLINDLHDWGSWSPWEKKDPTMKRTYSGAASGKGAVYEWDGDSNIGKGRMEITETSPPTRVVLALDFVKPFEAHNIVELTLAPAAGSTNVTWAMHGPNTFVSKVMSLFLSMDSMVGKEFEAGLATLKAITEK